MLNAYNRKIAGGIFVNDYEYPFIAGVISYREPEEPDCYKIHCGAVIVSEYHLITTAHCVSAENSYAVMAGIAELKSCYSETEVPQIRKVSVTVHDGYDSATMENDIAVLTTNIPLNFGSERLGPVCLPNPEGEYLWPEYGVVMGYGVTESEEEGSDVLRETSVSIANFDDCLTLYKDSPLKPFSGIMQFCTSGEGPCKGDSGGPLLIRNETLKAYVLRGLVSFGPEDCKVDFPSVYTNVQEYVTWLQIVTNEPLCTLNI